MLLSLLVYSLYLYKPQSLSVDVMLTFLIFLMDNICLQWIVCFTKMLLDFMCNFYVFLLFFTTFFFFHKVSVIVLLLVWGIKSVCQAKRLPFVTVPLNVCLTLAIRKCIFMSPFSYFFLQST